MQRARLQVKDSVHYFKIIKYKNQSHCSAKCGNCDKQKTIFVWGGLDYVNIVETMKTSLNIAVT